MTKLPTVSFEETDWGYTANRRYPSGVSQIEHILMPNGYLHKSRPGNPRPEDPEQGWRDTIRWTVPIDDENHRDFSLYLADATPEEARRYWEKRQETLAKLDRIPQTELIAQTLSGQMTTQELAKYRVPQGKLQDGVARWGQGAIADRSMEHLGYTDRSLLLYRKPVASRDARNLAEGRPLKPMWHCAGRPARHVGPRRRRRMSARETRGGLKGQGAAMSWLTHSGIPGGHWLRGTAGGRDPARRVRAGGSDPPQTSGGDEHSGRAGRRRRRPSRSASPSEPEDMLGLEGIRRRHQERRADGARPAGRPERHGRIPAMLAKPSASRSRAAPGAQPGMDRWTRPGSSDPM